MKRLNNTERTNWLKYKKQGMSNLHRCKVNSINVSIANSLPHELAKVKKAYELMKEGFKIITEADEISTGLRRDLVDISNDEIYEFETTMKRAIRFIGKPINLVPVGWQLADDKWKELVEKHTKT